MIQPNFLNLHTNNLAKDYVTIHLRLIQIDMPEVVILFMIYLIEYMF